jgi:hypothetical protein
MIPRTKTLGMSTRNARRRKLLLLARVAREAKIPGTAASKAVAKAAKAAKAATPRVAKPVPKLLATQMCLESLLLGLMKPFRRTASVWTRGQMST